MTIKSISTLAALALSITVSAGCAGDSSLEGGEAIDDEVVIVPQLGQAFTALESAEDAGFSDAIYLEDGGYILAYGNLDKAFEPGELPGIAEVVPADRFFESGGSWDERRYWNGELAADALAPTGTRTPGDWADREWNGDFALDNVEGSERPGDSTTIDWDDDLAR